MRGACTSDRTTLAHWPETLHGGAQAVRQTMRASAGGLDDRAGGQRRAGGAVPLAGAGFWRMMHLRTPDAATGRQGYP
jgi:hypothetical protein